MPAPEPADDAERDGAVPANDQRQPPSRRIGDRIGHLARHPDHLGQIAASRMVTIGNELRAGQISHVQNGLPSRAKPFCQPGSAQRVGCPLLPCMMRPGAAGHPDHHPLTHLSLLLVTSYCCHGSRQTRCRWSARDPSEQTIERNNADTFIGFLPTLDTTVPATTDIHLVMDNDSSHIAKKTKAWLATH